MKISTLLLLFAAFVSFSLSHAQPENGNGKSFVSPDADENATDFLASELEEMVLWRMLEQRRPDLRREKDDILEENHNLETLRKESLAGMDQYRHQAEQLEAGNATLEEENDNLSVLKKEIAFRIIELSNEKELLFQGEDEDYDLEVEIADAITEEIVLLDTQLSAYDRKIESNEEAIRIQSRMISETEDLLAETEETAQLCTWLYEANLGLVRQ
ncbi:MAG: hypothetical protein R3C61_23455 [Bacteroidia bacterium]